MYTSLLKVQRSLKGWSSATESYVTFVMQERSVNRNLPRRSVDSVAVSPSRTRSDLRLLGSHNRRSAASHLGRQRQPSVRPPLRSGARQRHCSGRRPLHSVRRRLQLSGRRRPQRSGRHRRLLSEHRHRRQHLARQPLRSVGARCSGRVRLLSAQARRQPSGARRRHHRLVSREWWRGNGMVDVEKW
jgi:hypothetical protein